MQVWKRFGTFGVWGVGYMEVIESRSGVSRVMLGDWGEDFERVFVSGAVWDWAVSEFGFERCRERLELMRELDLGRVIDLGRGGDGGAGEVRAPWRSVYCGECRSFSFKLKMRGDERVVLCANCEDEIGGIVWAYEDEE